MIYPDEWLRLVRLNMGIEAIVIPLPDSLRATDVLVDIACRCDTAVYLPEVPRAIESSLLRKRLPSATIFADVFICDLRSTYGLPIQLDTWSPRFRNFDVVDELSL